MRVTESSISIFGLVPGYKVEERKPTSSRVELLGEAYRLEVAV
jgi:hypothetical protein